MVPPPTHDEDPSAARPALDGADGPEPETSPANGSGRDADLLTLALVVFFVVLIGVVAALLLVPVLF